MTWKDETGIEKVNDLFIRLLGLGVREPVACRGQADSSWLLRTSLDRILDTNADYVARLAEERAVIEKFRVQAREYFGPLETNYLHGSHANDRISALTVLQHYRAPTRLLDWTASPWVALYFAAIDHHDKNGAIWWFNQGKEAFEDEVGRRWDKYGLRRDPQRNNEVDLNDTAFNSDGPPWITKLHSRVPFHRIEVQQGFFTVAGHLGLEHGELIADVLGEGQYARVVVPASWKQEILDRLRIMNIHSKSLDYPGADLVGTDLTRDLKRAQHRGNLNCSITEFGNKPECRNDRRLRNTEGFFDVLIEHS